MCKAIKYIAIYTQGTSHTKTKPNQTKGIETITNRQSACKWKILCVCESWCMWANKTDVQERINRKILGKLTENRQMQRHDPTQSRQILENGILQYELRIIAWNEQENLYMRWHGMAEKHFCGRSNSHTPTVVCSKCVFSMENLHCAFFFYFFFPVCINNDLEMGTRSPIHALNTIFPMTRN